MFPFSKAYSRLSLGLSVVIVISKNNMENMFEFDILDDTFNLTGAGIGEPEVESTIAEDKPGSA